MEISEFLAVESCKKDFTASSKEEAVRAIARLIAASPRVNGDLEDEIAEGLLAREKLGSTGFGDGIAVPHCKVEGMESFAMALAISPRGVPFKAMDNRSVHIVCGIAGPESDPDTHLRLLAAAARILSISRVRYEIVRSASRYALREAFLYHTSISAACQIDGEACRKLMVVRTLALSRTPSPSSVRKSNEPRFPIKSSLNSARLFLNMNSRFTNIPTR
ncbi:MAG: PTS sugar transporter subunit IIA, partial [Candidatus Fermentibacteraceae bacterium]